MSLLSNPPRTMMNFLTLAFLAVSTVNQANCWENQLLDEKTLGDKSLEDKTLAKILLRQKRDIYNLTDIATDSKEIMKLKMQAMAFGQDSNTEWEPILYRFTTQSSAEIGRLATWFTEISDFVQAYRYNRSKTTPDTRPENPDDTWKLNRPKLKGDMVGKPFHDPPWRIDQLQYLHCHIDDCKAWFRKAAYKAYVLHLYDHFFRQRNFYVTWPPYVTRQHFACYNASCGQSFDQAGKFFGHVHEHLIEEDVTQRTIFTTERTIGVADFFSLPKTSTPKAYFKQSCYICKKVYYTKESLDKHLIWHAFNGSFLYTPKRQTMPPPECPSCNLQFSSEDKQNKHWAEVHPQPGVKLELFREFYGHDTRNNPDPEGFPCPMCPKVCRLPSRLEKHLLWHARHSPPEEQWPPKRANKVYVVFGNTIPDHETTAAPKIFHDPPHIEAQLDQCRRELDEIDRNYTTPIYPQPEYVNLDDSDLTSEREDSRTTENKIPQTEELDEMDPNTSRYLLAKLRKPPKFCKTCHFITNDTLVFNRHYREHCWDVARLKLKLRSEIYDRMDRLYEEADRIRKKEWNQGILDLNENDFRSRAKRSATENSPIDEKQRKEFEQIREELEKGREKRSAENIAESIETLEALSQELKERDRRALREKRELDFEQIKLELKRAMYTVPYEAGQRCESCNRTDFKDKPEYMLHLQDHVSNKTFFLQAMPSPPTPYKSLEFTGHTTRSRNGSEEVRFRNIGRDIISDRQDFEIAKRRGLDNRTLEQYRRDRAIELGLKYGLLRTRKTTLPPASPPPSSKEINARLNQKLNDVKEKLKQYQERKNRGNKENQTDASREIDNKIEDLKRKMEDIKQKYNTTKKRGKRSPMGPKIPKDRIKACMDAEMKQKQKRAKKKGITLDDPMKTMFNHLGGVDILGRTTRGKNRHRRELPDDVLDDFKLIKNGTFLDRYDKDFTDNFDPDPTPKTTTTTTETPFPAIVDFGNGTTVSLLTALQLMRSKISVVMERYQQIHNMRGVTWNMELLRKYNMVEPLAEIREKNAQLNKTELLRRMANFEYFDQWDPADNQTAARLTSTVSDKERLEHEKSLQEWQRKFVEMKAELHAVVMKHFTREELRKMDPAVRRKIENLVAMPNSSEPARRARRDAPTTMIFTPRPFFEQCSDCTLNFTRKTEYYQHEFEHILNESYLAQANPTLNADQRYEQWKAERDNKTTPCAIDALLAKRTIPMFNDNANVEEMKNYFITKIHELSSRCHHEINGKAEDLMRRATSPLFVIDDHTLQPINKTEVVEVFKRVEQYYARQDQIAKEKAELEQMEKEAMARTRPGKRRRRNIGRRPSPNIINKRASHHFNKIYFLDEHQNKINRVRFEIEEIRYRYKKTLHEYLKERNQQVYHRRKRSLNIKCSESFKKYKITDENKDGTPLDVILEDIKRISEMNHQKSKFKNEMEEIKRTNDLVLTLHKYVEEKNYNRETKCLKLKKNNNENMEKLYNIRGGCHQKSEFNKKTNMKAKELNKNSFMQDRQERDDQKQRINKRNHLENELNENVVAWLQSIRGDIRVDSNDNLINTRDVKRRVKRTRTVSEMDTHELRESNDKILDSVSLHLQCEYCGLYFPSTEILYDHIRSRHDAKFQRDYLKGKFTDTDEREMTKTEDPLKQIQEGKINVNKLFDRRKREIDELDFVDSQTRSTYPPGWKKTAATKINWGTGIPYPEYSADINPEEFKSHMRFSNEIHECFYCKKNCSTYLTFVKHLVDEHQDMTSDPDQSLWMTEYYGLKPPRRKPKRRTTTIDSEQTKVRRTRGPKTRNTTLTKKSVKEGTNKNSIIDQVGKITKKRGRKKKTDLISVIPETTIQFTVTTRDPDIDLTYEENEGIPKRRIDCHICTAKEMSAEEFYEHMRIHLVTKKPTIVPFQYRKIYTAVKTEVVTEDYGGEFEGITRKKIDCHLCTAKGMNVDEFHEHMQNHLSDGSSTILPTFLETSTPSSTFKIKKKRHQQKSAELSDEIMDVTKKQIFYLDSSETKEKSKKSEEKIDASFVGVPRKTIDCHLCSATGMDVEEFHEHMLDHQAKAGFAVDSDRLDAQNRRFEEAARNNKKTTHLFSKESDEFSYVDRLLETQEFKKIVRAERQRAQISHSYDDRLDSAELPFNNTNTLQNKTSESKMLGARKKRDISKVNIKSKINNAQRRHKRVKRYYEILIPKNVKEDENSVGYKWRKEKEEEDAEEEREFENSLKNLTSQEKFIKKEARRKELFYDFFNKAWEQYQRIHRRKRDTKKISNRVKRYYEILIPKNVKEDENSVGYKWRKEKEEEDAEEEREFENSLKNLTSQEKFIKKEARRKELFYDFFNKAWEQYQRIHRRKRDTKKISNRVKRYYEILIPKNVKEDENSVGYKWRKEKEEEDAEEEREFENSLKNMTSQEKFIKKEARRKELFYDFFNKAWEQYQRIHRRKRDTKKISNRVKRYYEILIPKNVKEDENSVGYKWRKEKEEEDAEEEREFENSLKNLTSQEKFIKKEARRKELFYDFFNKAWEQYQRIQRGKRDIDSLRRNKRSAPEFSCPVCSKKFSTHVTLNEHIIADHKPKLKTTKKSLKFTLHRHEYDVKDLGEEYRNYDEFKTREYEDDIPLNVEIKNVNHTLIPYGKIKAKEYTPIEGDLDSIEDMGPTPAGFAKIAGDIKRIQQNDEKYNNKYMKMLFVTEKERTEEPTKAYDDYNINERVDKLFPSPRSHLICTQCGETFGSAMEAEVHHFDHRIKPHIEYAKNPEKFPKFTLPTDNLVIKHKAVRKVATAGIWGFDKFRADRFNSSEEQKFKTMDWFHFDFNGTSEAPSKVIWNLRYYNRTLKTWEVIPNVTIPAVERNPTIPKEMVGSVYSDFSSYESLSVDVKKPKSLEHVAREYFDSQNPPNETFFQQSYFDNDRNSSELYGSNEKFDEDDESSLMHSKEFDEIPSAILETGEEHETENPPLKNIKEKHDSSSIANSDDGNLSVAKEFAKEKENEKILEQRRLSAIRNKRKKHPHPSDNIENALNQFPDDDVSKDTDPNETPEASLPITSSFMKKYTGSSGSLYEHVNMTDYLNRKRYSVLYDPHENRNTTRKYKEYKRIRDFKRDEIDTEKANRKENIRAILKKYNITRYPDLDEHYKDDSNLLKSIGDNKGVKRHTVRKILETKVHRVSKQSQSIEEIKRNDITTIFAKNEFGRKTFMMDDEKKRTSNPREKHYHNHVDDFMKNFQDERVNIWDTHVRDNKDILSRFEKSRKAQEEKNKIPTTRKTKPTTVHYIYSREPTFANKYERMKAAVEDINNEVRKKWAMTSRRTKATTTSTTTTEKPRTVIDYREQDAKFNQGCLTESEDEQTTALDSRYFAKGSDDMEDIAENRFGLPGGGGGGRGGGVVNKLKGVDRALKLDEQNEVEGENSMLEDDDPKNWQFAGGTWGPNENMCDYDQIKKDMLDYYELYLRPRNLTTVNYDGLDYCKFCNVTKRKNELHFHGSHESCSEDHSAIVRNKSYTIFPLEFRLKQCNVCNKTFDIPIRDEAYWNHVRSHNRPIISEKDFMYDAWNNYGQCSVCNKTFIPSHNKEWYLYHLYNHSEAGHICVNWTLDDYPYFSLPLNFTGDSYNSYDKYDNSLDILDMGGTNPRYSRFVTAGTVVTWFDNIPEVYEDDK